MTINWTEELFARIREMHEQKMGRRQIAKALGISRDTLAPMMNERGLRLPAGLPGAKPWTDADDNDLRSMSKRGDSTAKMATALGRTIPAISDRRIKLGIADRRGFVPMTEDERAIRRRLQDEARRRRNGVRPRVKLPDEEAAERKRASDRLGQKARRDAQRAQVAPSPAHPALPRAVPTPPRARPTRERFWYEINEWAAQYGLSCPNTGFHLPTVNAFRERHGLDPYRIKPLNYRPRNGAEPVFAR